MAQIKNKTKFKSLTRRAGAGQVTAEFAAAFAVLICLILIPLLSAVFIPIRYSMSQGAVTELVTRLAHSEKRSDAYKTLMNDQRWIKVLASFGAEVKSVRLILVATTTSGSGIVVPENSTIPKEWLPDGSKGPYTYSLHLDCQCAIAPLFGGTGTITGINAPVNLTVSSSAHWENVSRDPKSSTFAFYINE